MKIYGVGIEKGIFWEWFVENAEGIVPIIILIAGLMLAWYVHSLPCPLPRNEQTLLRSTPARAIQEEVETVKYKWSDVIKRDEAEERRIIFPKD